jgi:hypothetical protein
VNVFKALVKMNLLSDPSEACGYGSLNPLLRRAAGGKGRAAGCDFRSAESRALCINGEGKDSPEKTMEGYYAEASFEGVPSVAPQPFLNRKENWRQQFSCTYIYCYQDVSLHALIFTPNSFPKASFYQSSW